VAISGIAATERDPWRGRLLRGEVHDENAFALGGVAGHAGLFGTAMAVSALTEEWLRAWEGHGRLLDGVLARQFTTRQDVTPGSSWGLGWDTPSPPSSSGRHFSFRSFGHLGYTGTSIWIDPESELEVILLSNRVHPTRSNTAIQQFRPLIHDSIYDELVAGSR
jgi:CubicO group peptidase (beta-lactamase class C family)